MGEKLDRNIITLVEALNSFEGIETFGSCGGHKNPKPGQWPAGTFYVKFDISWDTNGLYALEFLSWLINNKLAKFDNKALILYPYSPPPFWNTPGKVLCFILEGHGGMKPGQLARLLVKSKNELYVPPEEMKNKG